MLEHREAELCTVFELKYGAEWKDLEEIISLRKIWVNLVGDLIREILYYLLNSPVLTCLDKSLYVVIPQPPPTEKAGFGIKRAESLFPNIMALGSYWQPSSEKL